MWKWVQDWLEMMKFDLDMIELERKHLLLFSVVIATSISSK